MNNIYREDLESKFNIPLDSERAKEIMRKNVSKKQ